MAGGRGALPDVAGCSPAVGGVVLFATAVFR